MAGQKVNDVDKSIRKIILSVGENALGAFNRTTEAINGFTDALVTYNDIYAYDPEYEKAIARMKEIVVNAAKEMSEILEKVKAKK